MEKITKICWAICLSLFFVSCVEFNHNISNNEIIEGSGKVTTDNRNNLQGFDKIKVSNAINVVLDQSPDFEVLVEADDNVLPYIITEVSNQTLHVYLDNVSVKNPKKMQVSIKMPDISGLKATSSAEIKADRMIKTNDLVIQATSAGDISLAKVRGKSVDIDASSSADIEIDEIFADTFMANASSTADIVIDYVESEQAVIDAGSSADVKIERIQANSCKIDSSSTSDVEVEAIDANKIEVDAGSSADVLLAGKTNDLIVRASSSATIDAHDLSAKNVDAAASSSGTIMVYPVHKLSASASSSGDIYYYHTPQTIDKETSSSGSINQK